MSAQDSTGRRDRGIVAMTVVLQLAALFVAAGAVILVKWAAGRDGCLLGWSMFGTCVIDTGLMVIGIIVGVCAVLMISRLFAGYAKPRQGHPSPPSSGGRAPN